MIKPMIPDDLYILTITQARIVSRVIAETGRYLDPAVLVGQHLSELDLNTRLILSIKLAVSDEYDPMNDPDCC